MLTLTDVRAGYGGSRVLQGIDLDVPGGSVTALMGRNGMGKTTLLRTIMGLVRADGGRIRLDGRDIAGLEPHRVAGRGVGYVPQGREIFADLTVAENLRLGLLGRGLSNLPASHAVRFPMLVARAGQRAGALSGGQQQILAIARALVAAPRVLLLDEPSEGIQPSIVADIARLLAAIVAEDGITVLLVEQNVDLVFALAQRCAFLENGRVVAQHAVAEARADPGLLARHLAVKPWNP